MKLEGQADAKEGSFTFFTFHVDSAAMGLEDHFGMEHSDPDAGLLCCAEWAEERALDKVRAHPTPGIGNADYSPAVSLSGFNKNPTSGRHRFSGIEQQIGHYLLHLDRIQPDFRQ